MTETRLSFFNKKTFGSAEGLSRLFSLKSTYMGKESFTTC